MASKTSGAGSWSTPLLFGSTIVLSSFLLFQIQPMISKIILPWFGGGPAVWTAAMLFFQVLLLGGYAYAHYLSIFSIQRQALIHLLVLACIFAWLLFVTLSTRIPILPNPGLKPSPGSFPVWQVLWVLLTSVGIPYLLLSTTSSLSQVWFAGITASRSPYIFYAFSNAASLAALLSYPFAFEPYWTVKEQASFWSIGFFLYLVFIAICAFQVFRAVTTSSTRNTTAAAQDAAPETSPSAAEGQSEVPAPSARGFLLWVGLAACPSVLLLAVTNQITQDVAAVPFLWVVPLSLYLISFVLTFNQHFMRFLLWVAVLAFLTLWLGYVILEYTTRLSIIQVILADSVLLLFACLFFHGFLYSRRPHLKHLTKFYLALSIGGALGGILVSIVAPLVFPDYWEYPLILLACAASVTWLAFRRRDSWFFHLRFPLLIASLLLTFLLLRSTWTWINGSLETYRSFYGVLRIRQMDYKDSQVYNLVHGRIIHGSQAAGDTGREMPTRYYSPSTGIGIAISDSIQRLENQPLRFGMVGLGIGTVAAYGLPGDTIRFYEINPKVVNIAYDRRYFSYLADSRASIEIVLGDARLSMEIEAADPGFEKYDILAVDAFSGDSIPTHLINREAVDLYLRLLKEDGLLAFHISNRYLDLEPLVGRLAEEAGLLDAKIVGGGGDWLGTQSTWILLSRTPVALGTPALSLVKLSVVHKPGMRLWTDDFSNLFQVLR